MNSEFETYFNNNTNLDELKYKIFDSITTFFHRFKDNKDENALTYALSFSIDIDSYFKEDIKK